MDQQNKYLNLIWEPKKEKLVKEGYYSFDKVLERLKPGKSMDNPLPLEDLRHEQNEMKKELQQLKQRVKLLENKNEPIPENFEIGETLKNQEDEFINSMERYIK